MQARSSRSRIIVSFFLASVGFGGGCAAPGADSTRESTADSDYKIRIERPGADEASLTARPSASTRTLAFEMTGVAIAESSRPEGQRKAAMVQAAAIDALIKAVIEARRARGQTTADFTMKIGPRLTIVHQQLGDDYEVQISLIARGADVTFVLRGGVLQHEPYEQALLRRVFEETNGEFSLLTTEWDPARGGCKARVACYLPAGPQTIYAGDPRFENEFSP